MRLGSSFVSLAALLLSACGAYNGSWPRLGPTAADAEAVMTQEERAAQTATQTLPSAAPNADTDLDEVTPRLAAIAGNFSDVDSRLDSQLRALSSALSRVRGQSSENWSSAQLELSRLNQVASELETVRGEAASLAGDLAGLSAKGKSVGAAVAQAGSLINRIDQRLNDVAVARGTARAALTS